MLLMLLMTVMSIGSAWGKITQIFSGPLNDYVVVTPASDVVFKVGTILHVDFESDTNLYIVDKNWAKVFDSDWYYQWKKYYQFEITTDAQANALKAGIVVKTGGSNTVVVSVENEDAPLDDFLSTATPKTDTGDSYELPSRSETSYTLSMTKPLI